MVIIAILVVITMIESLLYYNVVRVIMVILHSRAEHRTSGHHCSEHSCSRRVRPSAHAVNGALAGEAF